jgi:ribulose 1,5-bisphosphate synthetase/thiazole synthase
VGAVISSATSSILDETYDGPFLEGEMKDNDAKRRDVIVVGGGQAGLAVGYFLAQQGRDFTILEAAAEPAAA